MFEFMAQEAFLRTTIEKNTCVKIVEKKRTGNHVRICHRFFMANCQNSPHTTSILCLWAVSLEVPNFVTLITRLAYSRSRDLRYRLCWCFTEVVSMPLLVAVSAMHFPANSRVMEVTFISLWQSSNITIRGCWSSKNDGRCR
ncbi:hypothetical protein QRY61_09040, partial [Campylobacter jejuni]|uniref:hypothetical protein n=1 Tax=Campylobacter jejuni TaxID=197 RepID=UPI002B22D8FB